MKKRLCIIFSIMILILMFIIADVFNVYHFGSMPTLLTCLYLIIIFIILEYVFFSFMYIIKRKIKKEKIGIKKIIGLGLLFISLVLVLLCVLVIDIDWLNWYAYQTPFYKNVIIRIIEFILPAIIFIIVGIRLLKNK